MSTKFFLLSILVIFLSCKNADKNQIILKNYSEKISSKKSISYDVNFKMKLFSSSTDTLNYNVNCRIIKDKKDTIFGGVVWIKNDSIERYYDTKHIYIIEHNKNKVTRYFVSKGEQWAILGSTVGKTLNSYFVNPSILKEYDNDSLILKRKFDTVLKNKEYNSILFNFPDGDPFKNEKKFFLFDKNQKLSKIYYSVNFQDKTQYNEWIFRNKKYNSVTKGDLEKEFKNLLKNYSIEDHVGATKEDRQLLKNYTLAPNFKGKTFNKGLLIELNKMPEKIIILDFWYKNCYPCIKSIPHLIELRKKYSQKDLMILGLNSKDINANEKEMQKFIEKNKVNYPVVFIDKSVEKLYNINIFPSLYILDKNKKILFSKIGYSSVGEKEIDSVLKLVLNKEKISQFKANKTPTSKSNRKPLELHYKKSNRS